MNEDIKKILISEEELRNRVAELGRQITEDYKGEEILIIGVLRGAFVFMADLARNIDLPMSVDFMCVSSYGGGTETTGNVKILKDLDDDIEGKHVIIAEDILDSGVTLSNLMELLKKRKPASIKIASLLDKPARHRTQLKLDYCGFVIPDEFIVGYGLDYDQKYRNLPYIGILKSSVYDK